MDVEFAVFDETYPEALVASPLDEQGTFPKKGKCTFEPNENRCSFIVDFVDNPVWNVEAIFTVAIVHPVKNFRRGDLRLARVVVVNDDFFPQGYSETHEGGDRRPALVHVGLVCLTNLRPMLSDERLAHRWGDAPRKIA